MTAEQITTLEEARDFLAARYPGNNVTVTQEVESSSYGNKSTSFCAYVTGGDLGTFYATRDTLAEAVEYVCSRADLHTPEALERERLEAEAAKEAEAKTLLETAGWTVSKTAGS